MNAIVSKTGYLQCHSRVNSSYIRERPSKTEKNVRNPDDIPRKPLLHSRSVRKERYLQRSNGAYDIQTFRSKLSSHVPPNAAVTAVGRD
jgi:hypothetical protein